MSKKIFIVTVILTLLALVFTACSAGAPDTYLRDITGHENHYVQFFPSKTASCSEEGSLGYYYCHHCNQYLSHLAPFEKITKSQAVIEKIPHDFQDNICKRCGFDCTLGLSFLPTADESGYVVSGDKNLLSSSLVIPQSYQGKPVVEIAEKGFANCTSLEDILVPDSVKKIGKSAFEGCKPKSITLPFVGESEEENRFLGYIFGAEFLHSADTKIPTSLRIINLGDKCKVIPRASFRGCANLLSLNLNKVEKIEIGAFSGCVSLEEIVVSSIENWFAINHASPIPSPFSLFVEGEQIKNIKVEDGAEVKAFAFANCISVENLVLSKNIQIFDASALENSGIISITFEGSQSEFATKTDLSKIEIPLFFGEE